MSEHPLKAPSDERSTLRQLKILVGILILSNVALGVFGFYFLRTIDRKYSNLIGQAVPTLNDLQTLTAISMEAMRSTNPTLFDASKSRAEIMQRARSALRRDRDLRNNILKRDWFSNEKAERRDFADAGEAFNRTAEGVINLLGSAGNAEAGRQREQLLRPAFDRYVAATTKAADVLEAESLQTSSTLTARTGNISTLMIGLGSWPLMIFGVLLLVTAVFVVVVLLNVFLRKREAM